jgi:hypothetical protein
LTLKRNLTAKSHIFFLMLSKGLYFTVITGSDKISKCMKWNRKNIDNV